MFMYIYIQTPASTRDRDGLHPEDSSDFFTHHLCPTDK